MHLYKLILCMYVLVAAHLFPSVTMFDFGTDFGKWIDRVQKAKPLEFVNRVVETFKKGDANEEEIITIVSEGVDLVNTFTSQDTDSVPSANEPPRPPVQPVKPTSAHPTNNHGQSNPNKVTLEVTRTQGGVKINESIFIPDSHIDMVGRFVPGLKGVMPGNSPQSVATRPVATINPERSEEHLPRTTAASVTRMTSAPYLPRSTTRSPITNSDHIVTSPERMRLEFTTKTTGGYMFNETLFITESHINLVRNMVPGFSSLFPNISSNSDQPLEQSNKIILLVAKTADGVLINDTVVIHDDSLSLAREAVPWLNDIFPSHFGVEQVKEANPDHLKAQENSAEPKTYLFSAIQILLVLPLFQIM